MFRGCRDFDRVVLKEMVLGGGQRGERGFVHRTRIPTRNFFHDIVHLKTAACGVAGRGGFKSGEGVLSHYIVSSHFVLSRSVNEPVSLLPFRDKRLPPPFNSLSFQRSLHLLRSKIRAFKTLCCGTIIRLQPASQHPAPFTETAP